MKWPGDAQCAVCLTFDLDGEVVWTSKIPQDPAFGSALVRSMGRFGPETAMPRILELLERLQVRAGFFIVGKVAEQYPALVKDVHRRGHEVAHHSYSHVNPARQKPEETWEEFARAHEILQSLTGAPPRGFRSPAADMSATAWKFLTEFGFVYDSSLMTRELPYICEVQNHPIVEIPFHWMLDDWPHFGFNMYPCLPYMSGISSQEKVHEIWLEEFEGIYEAGLLFMLVMHPQLTGRYSRLRMLARLVKHMKERGNVWFATPQEVATYWLEQHRGKTDEKILV
jgi:peptidoglycan/xylan/chitin deacetylase (PgdA/CDA1 family)